MPRPTLHRSPYGTSPEGRAVDLWRLDSGTGVTAEVLTYGGILHSLRVPDTLGNACSVVLSLASVAEYAEKSPYFGALIGRYANRIAHGRFTLDGTRYHVPPNDRGHALHGGPEGFDSRIWRAEPVPSGDTASLRLSLHSPDGDMGFPGTLEATVAYALDPAGTLAVDYTASTDRPTVVNLTHHPYFNLSGRGGDVLDHTLQVEAGSYLPVDADGIPLGPLAPVQDTAFDLSSPRRIGDMLALPDPQLRQAGGYDHCWALRTGSAQGEPRRAARLSAPAQARVMEVWTTEPGLQVYTGNQLDGSLAGADGHPHLRHGAVCLETQHFPDSPNHSAYPATELRPEQILRSRTEYRFPHLAAPGERGERD